VVLTILGVCLGAISARVGGSVRAEEARGAAQSWQAAAAWAQLGVVWQGGTSMLSYGEGSLAVSHDHALCGGDLGRSTPDVSVRSNVSRWEDGDGARVSFVGPSAAPDGGGSLYFHAIGSEYRVVVRPESGLTVRSVAP